MFRLIFAAAFAGSVFAADEAPSELKLGKYNDLGTKSKVQKVWLQEFAARLARNVGSANRGEGAKLWEGKNNPSEGLFLSYVEEPLLPAESGDPRPPKLKRTYDRAVRGEAGKDVPLAYQGKTVIVERGADKQYKFHYPDGGLVIGDGRTALEKEFNHVGGPDQLDAMNHLFTLMMPGSGVRQGETWDIDTKPLADIFGKLQLHCNLDSSRGQGKCVRIYMKKDRRYAVLNMNVRLVLDKVLTHKADTGSKIDFIGSMDVAIDGKGPAGTMEVNAKIWGGVPFPDAWNGGTVSLVLDGKLQAKQVITPTVTAK